MLFLLFKLFYVFNESLLVDESGILTVPQYADVPQPQLYKTLIDQVHWRMNVQSHRSLQGPLVTPYRTSSHYDPPTGSI